MKKDRWEIVFEDDDLILINKPSGLLSIPDRYNPEKENLSDSLKKYRDNIFINHRLDKETSGLIIFSKNENSHKSIQMQFENGTIEKKYTAIVIGNMFNESGIIDLPLSYSASKKITIIDKKGKSAHTEYKVVTHWTNYSLLEVSIKTGRTHQIRVHLSGIGYPVLGDRLYGDGKGFYVSTVKRNYKLAKEENERPLLSRTALHASNLTFKHPSTDKLKSFSQDLPKDMNAVVKQLDKWASL